MMQLWLKWLKYEDISYIVTTIGLQKCNICAKSIYQIVLIK